MICYLIDISEKDKYIGYMELENGSILLENDELLYYNNKTYLIDSKIHIYNSKAGNLSYYIMFVKLKDEFFNEYIEKARKLINETTLND